MKLLTTCITFSYFLILYAQVPSNPFWKGGFYQYYSFKGGNGVLEKEEFNIPDTVVDFQAKVCRLKTTSLTILYRELWIDLDVTSTIDLNVKRRKNRPWHIKLKLDSTNFNLSDIENQIAFMCRKYHVKIEVDTSFENIIKIKNRFAIIRKIKREKKELLDAIERRKWLENKQNWSDIEVSNERILKIIANRHLKNTRIYKSDYSKISSLSNRNSLYLRHKELGLVNLEIRDTIVSLRDSLSETKNSLTEVIIESKWIPEVLITKYGISEKKWINEKVRISIDKIFDFEVQDYLSFDETIIVSDVDYSHALLVYGFNLYQYNIKKFSKDKKNEVKNESKGIQN